MRLLVRLRAEADAAYVSDYHRGLAGRVWQGLDRPEFDDIHESGEPSGICFSNVFPVEEIEEGDRRNVLISAAQDGVLQAIAADLIEDREFNAGEMPFSVKEVTGISPDVGEPGTEGVLETASGLVVRIPHYKFEEYDIDAPGTAPEFWKPEHSLEPLRVQLENNLDRKHNLFCADHLPGPSDVDGPLFTSYEHIKTYALPVTVTEGETHTHVVSKFRFGYRVRDDDHRRHLNLALDTGLAERNSLGFGFVNVREDELQPPGGAA